MKNSFENFMNDLSDEQKQLIQLPQISQTTQNSNINSEEVNSDDHLESQLLKPTRFCHIFKKINRN